MQSESIQIYLMLSLRVSNIACLNVSGMSWSRIEKSLSLRLLFVVVTGWCVPQQWLNVI